jgi:hypothetical protein
MVPTYTVPQIIKVCNSKNFQNELVNFYFLFSIRIVKLLLQHCCSCDKLLRKLVAPTSESYSSSDLPKKHTTSDDRESIWMRPLQRAGIGVTR